MACSCRVVSMADGFMHNADATTGGTGDVFRPSDVTVCSGTGTVSTAAKRARRQAVHKPPQVCQAACVAKWPHLCEQQTAHCASLVPASGQVGAKPDWRRGLSEPHTLRKRQLHTVKWLLGKSQNSVQPDICSAMCVDAKARMLPATTEGDRR